MGAFSKTPLYQRFATNRKQGQNIFYFFTIITLTSAIKTSYARTLRLHATRYMRGHSAGTLHTRAFNLINLFNI